MHALSPFSWIAIFLFNFFLYYKNIKYREEREREREREWDQGTIVIWILCWNAWEDAVGVQE